MRAHMGADTKFLIFGSKWTPSVNSRNYFRPPHTSVGNEIRRISIGEIFETNQRTVYLMYFISCKISVRVRFERVNVRVIGSLSQNRHSVRISSNAERTCIISEVQFGLISWNVMKSPKKFRSSPCAAIFQQHFCFLYSDLVKKSLSHYGVSINYIIT